MHDGPHDNASKFRALEGAICKIVPAPLRSIWSLSGRKSLCRLETKAQPTQMQRADGDDAWGGGELSGENGGRARQTPPSIITPRCLRAHGTIRPGQHGQRRYQESYSRSRGLARRPSLHLIACTYLHLALDESSYWRLC